MFKVIFVTRESVRKATKAKRHRECTDNIQNSKSKHTHKCTHTTIKLFSLSKTCLVVLNNARCFSPDLRNKISITFYKKQSRKSFSE